METGSGLARWELKEQSRRIELSPAITCRRVVSMSSNEGSKCRKGRLVPKTESGLSGDQLRIDRSPGGWLRWQVSGRLTAYASLVRSPSEDVTLLPALFAIPLPMSPAQLA